MKKKGKHVDETEGKYRSIRQEIVKKKREREGEQTFFFICISVKNKMDVCFLLYAQSYSVSSLNLRHDFYLCNKTPLCQKR